MIADLLERLWMSYFQTYRHMVLLMYTSNTVLALKAEEAPFFWGLNELYLPSSTQFSKWKMTAIRVIQCNHVLSHCLRWYLWQNRSTDSSHKDLCKRITLASKHNGRSMTVASRKLRTPSRLYSSCRLLVLTIFQDSPCIPASFVILWHSVQGMISPLAFKTITLRGKWGLSHLLIHQWNISWVPYYSEYTSVRKK